MRLGPLLAVVLLLLAPALAAAVAPPVPAVPAPSPTAPPAPAGPATRGQLAAGVVAIAAARAAMDAGTPAPAQGRIRRLAAGLSARPEAPVPARLAHRAIVTALGLDAERAGLARITAGGVPLRHPADLPSEVLVRELGLRENREAPEDALERTRGEALDAAELADVIDRAAALEPWDLGRLAPYRTIALPPMGPVAQAVVEAGLAQVGLPYVWAGDAPSTASPWGPQAHGGFDCSGLVWWAYKGDPRAAATGAGAAVRGRTADAMAWEAPADRIPAEQAAPGDLVFFGSAGRRTRKGAVEHAAIALGDGWILHSAGSRAGPSITRLADYWPSGTAFARRMALG